ncbi:MAG: Fic family protein [Nitrospirae bacterium]|nr:Fic family protein [Nitrospirota bacterium]
MSQAPPIVATLIDRFEQNRESYKSQGYNETQVRREFLDPFFEALGWDVANKQGHAEAYKDVIHEDAIKIGGNTKAPDYCFRIGGARKFFLEAKKPAVNVKDEISPAYQLRRYAWSAKLPLSILTDFEEFAVYDCRTRPNPSDKPSTGRILYLTYRDYLEKWDEIASIFTKEAVLKGSFDKYAISDRKRGTTTVDAEFLKEIESWREALAKNLAVRNPTLSVHELNFSVQRTIDRLIFLRICEDRGIEPPEQLRLILNRKNIYDRLQAVYKQADDRYNSGLFHFHAEKDRAESPDDLTPRLKIDDTVLKDIISRLYYPQSPYAFSVFPTEILGQVYEQFLGKVIRLTAGHQAKVEEKPEVKKAGGVYYTPAYIVEYIVKHTVGSLCEGKTPAQVAKLYILDPACGSGSFLLGAYSYLLNWHQKWYVEHGPEKHRKELFKGMDGDWRLKTAEKRRILLNNIYGVDIDSQAVEVSKLSLLLKVLEGENKESMQELLFGRVRALPDLGQNIKCGNSLIGPDYFAGQLMPDDEEMRRVNPFDWKAEFSEIMKAGGFDAVIGNPPWVSLSGKFKNDVFPKPQVDYLINHFHGNTYMPNMYEYFVSQGLNLTRERGFFSFIVPDRLGFNSQFVPLRNRILTESRIVSLLYKAPFSGVTADTLIFALQKGRPDSNSVKISEYNKADILRPQHELLRQPAHTFEYFESADIMKVIAVLEEPSRTMHVGDLCDSTSGFGGKSALIQEIRTNPKQIRTMKGDSIGRYQTKTLYWFEFKPQNITGRTTDTLKLGAKRKVLLRKTGDKIIATYDDSGIFPEQSLYFLFNPHTKIELKFILGILNSKLLGVYYQARSLTNRRSIAQVKKVDLDQLPIPRLNLLAPEHSAKHDSMVSLVECMLDLRRRLANTTHPDDKTRLQRQIDATDREIDRLVYDLYGLTEEEIKIVEAASVASSLKVKENDSHESETKPDDRPRASRGEAQAVAQPAQYPGEGGGGTSESPAGASEPVHGVRESAGQYGSPQDPDGDAEGQSELGSTREFETAEGRLSYQELSEHLAVPLVAIYDEILQSRPEQIILTSEWLCVRHKRLAGHLFPDWAGRFRDVNVQVGSHTPPPYYEVPIHMRQFCDDLSVRLLHLNQESVANCAELLAWADWRFQWIHPFKDFNGRIGRVLLAAMLYKLGLPHVETAPPDPEARTQYLGALGAADQGDLTTLAELWIRRFVEL